MFRVYCIMNKVWTEFRQPTEAGKHLETDLEEAQKRKELSNADCSV